MTTVVAIYTGQGLAEPLKAVFNEAIPGCRLVNIIDDSLIADVMRDQEVTPAVTRRLLQYYQTAVEIGADVILNTCSSVGEVVALGQQVVDVPIVRIDEPMAAEAVQRYDRVGVIATLPTTLVPTLRLLQTQAEKAGRAVTLVSGLAEGAYQALVNGSPEKHDERIMETALRLKPQVDAFVLAQGSMARMERTLAEATGLPVLSSLRRGVEAVKAVLEKQQVKT